MAVVTLKAFTGSIKNRNYTGETHNIYVNTLSPSSAECDAYGEPYNPGSTNHGIGIYLTSIGKINALLGGSASAVAVHKFINYGDHDEEFNHIYVSHRRSERLFTRVNWENPINGNILVTYSHWHTEWKNGDVTFETFEPEGSDVRYTTYRASGFNYYTAFGGYYGKLEGDATSIILFIHPTDTYSADTLYYFPPFYFARFSTWTQWDEYWYEEFGPHYWSADGTPWMISESHEMLYQNVYGMDYKTMSWTESKATNWGIFLFGNIGILPTIYWNGDYDKEIFYKGRYHKSGWLYENGQWTYAWERCPYEGFDD